MSNSVKKRKMRAIMAFKVIRKLAISLQRGQFDPKLQVEGVAPHQSFLHG